MSFVERERRCENTFFNSGPWYHLYTPGKNTSVFLVDDEDFSFVINLLARCLLDFTGLKILAFAVMNNHIHIVISGDKENVLAMFAIFRRRLSRYLSSKGRDQLPLEFQAEFKEIRDLRTMRNTIVYVNRNGYVVDPDHTPFSYPWGTGRFFFNPFPLSKTFQDLSEVEIRTMFKSRNPKFPDGYMIINHHVSPSSFCAVSMGMAMFANAHQYFSMISRNVEAYSEIAEMLDDGEFLTDSELSSKLFLLVREQYNVTGLRNLSHAQKLDLARTMHYSFKSSNGQIRRLLNLLQVDIDSLFPLSSKT